MSAKLARAKFDIKKMSLLLVVILMIFFLGGAIFSTVWFSRPKRAIIMVTPLLGGGLYDAETGQPVWDPFKRIELDIAELLAAEDIMTSISNIGSDIIKDSKKFHELMAIFEKIKNDAPDSLLNQIQVDYLGNSVNKNIKPANDFDGKIYYGLLGLYKPMMTELEKLYGDKFDVKMFNYDWRMDNTENSRLLEEFINENDYDEVIIMSHSMGGNVTSGYLARSAQNREKVIAYMPFSASFLGSVDALDYLENMLSFIREIDLDLSKLNTMGIDLDNIVGKLELLIQNCFSITQLLPTYELISSDQYNQLGSAVKVDGVAITSREDLYNFYRSRDWAYLRNENQEFVDMDGNVVAKENRVLRPAVSKLEEFHDSLYVDVKGEKVFSPRLVNTYYFVGCGEATKVCFELDSEANKGASITNAMGDNMVPLYSQLGGLRLNEIEGGHLFMYEKTHMEVGGSWALIKDDVLSVIDMFA